VRFRLRGIRAVDDSYTEPGRIRFEAACDNGSFIPIDSTWTLFVTTATPDDRKARPARRGILPPSYERTLGHAQRIELADDRPIRERNKISYRFAHWPIWIWVFFIAPGPLTFDLFERGFDMRMAVWLGVVLLGTGIAGLRGRLPGVEPRPYIIRFTEDRPNPLYRRVCYTLAWSEVIAFAILNISGLVMAIATGAWRMRQLYDLAYFPIVVTIWLLGAFGLLPRVKASTQNEGHERRYFYGSVWAVCIAQPVLWFLWRALPRSTSSDAVKLAVFVGILAYVGNMARRGLLPRTRPIVPGEIAVSD
jgi:hypothetical protein